MSKRIIAWLSNSSLTIEDSDKKYKDEFNAWLERIPHGIKQLVLCIKRFHQPDWGSDWRKYFSVDILDGEPGKPFDKMLGSINLSRDNIALASYIKIGFENYYDNENFLNEIQLFNYRVIELINPRYLIIMSNYCIKMLLATD